jgi:hypothetical protein
VAYLTVHLDDGTDVRLSADGAAEVDLAAMHVARHDLLGRISVYLDGSVQVWQCEDGMFTAPLPERVIRAAENAARRQAARAWRTARVVAKGKRKAEVSDLHLDATERAKVAGS